jgi:hypothetical protein
MSTKMARTAEIQYSPDYSRIELVVPQGTKVSQLTPILEALGRGKFGGLPRGCPNCTSGDHLTIRERLEHVIRVDLETGSIIGE